MAKGTAASKQIHDAINGASITPQEKAAAGAAAKADKAAKEAARRAKIKAVNEQCEKAGMTEQYKDLDADQRDRAVDPKKAGLQNGALKAWILEGKDMKAQQADGQLKDASERAAVKERKNLSQSNDPDAAKLARDAKALAPERKSAFLPKDAREFIDTFSVKRVGETIEVSKENGVKELFIRETLEAHTIGGVADKGVRAALAVLAKDTRLYGGKLALMVLAQAA